MSRLHLLKVPLTALALAICAGTAQATVLTSAITVGTALKCDTNAGPSGSVTIKLTASTALSTNIITVSLPAAPAGITVTAPGALTLNSATASVTYTFTPTAGCAGTTLGANTPAVQFKAAVGAGGASNDIAPTLSLTVLTTGATSPLAFSVNSVTLACTKAASGTYTGSSQNVNVTSSSAGGGTAVTIDPTTDPAWLTITAPSPNLASSSAVAFGLAVSSGNCSGAVGSSKTATLHFLNVPATAYDSLTVILQVVGPTPLTLSPPADGVISTPLSLVYTKNQLAALSGTVAVKGASLFFGVDTTTLPSWITVNSTSGQATVSGFSLIFTVTRVADTMTPGIYGGPAAIHLKVAGYADTVVYLSLTVQNAAAVLNVAEGTVRNLTWSVGQPLPTATITALSSGSPIPFTVVTTNPGSNGANPGVSENAGLAYSFGTPIGVTFDPLAFAGATPGSVLSGTVTLDWTGTAIPINFSISIQAPGTNAVLTGISPSNLPSAPSGQTFTVSLYGSGFVSSTDPTQKTTVGIVVAGVWHTDANIVSNVLNASTIVLTITVPSLADPLVFSSQNTLTIGVCNPAGATCSTATGTAALIIGAGPIVQTGGVTSASTFVPVASPAGTVAPYDILSIFGSNFCSSNGTGCTASQVLYATLGANLTYGTTLTPDSGQRNLQVFFYNQGQQITGPGAAPLLFASNNQINVVVPGGVVATQQYDIVVKFGALTSTPYTVTAAATDPGVFTIDSAGTGAIVLPNGSINSSTNPARMRTVATDSDTVSIFMTGLGLPLSVAANTTGGSHAAFTDCISPSAYKTAGGNLTSLDGVVIQSALIYPGRLVPCFDPATVTAKVGNVLAGANSSYAGWAPDSIAGLYQVNVQLAALAAAMTNMAGTAVSVAGFTTSVEVPLEVYLTAPSTHSQAYNGTNQVGIWVEPAATLKTTTGPIAYSIAATTLTAAATTPGALDTLITTGGSGTVYTLSAISGGDSAGVAVTSDFTVDSALGTIVINRAYLTGGIITITFSATDHTGGTALPVETITLTITIT
jgi:uncharacterized protein (TIGR03437 family)